MDNNSIQAIAPPENRGTRPSRWRRLIGWLFVAALAGILSVASAPQAQAWPWSSNVNVMGFAGCRSVSNALDVPAQATWVYLYSTGEVEQQSVSWTEYWEAHLHSVPAAGSWAAVWEYCAVPGTQPGWRFAQYIWVTRPWVGSYIGPYWQSA